MRHGEPGLRPSLPEYHQFREEVREQARLRRFNLDMIHILLQDDRFASLLSRAAWDVMEAEGREPQDLDPIEVILELASPPPAT